MTIMKKLNLGSGSKRKDGFINLDKYNTFNPDIVHDLELFGVVNAHSKDLEKEIKENFLKSKIFNWLIARLKKSENQEIYFGHLSSIIHDSLLDDPKPYRQNIKLMQSNLLSYIKYFNLSNITVDIPGKKSERIKLI